MTKSVQIIFILTLLPWLSSKASDPYHLKHFQAEEWEFSTKADFAQSTANYSRVGNQFERLPDGYAYQIWNFNFAARYIAFPRIALNASLEMGSAQSKNPLANRTNSGISNMWLGAEYLLFSSQKFELIPEVQFAYPVEKVDPAQDKALIGDGVMQLHSQVTAQLHWGFFHPFFAGGFNYRTEGLSSLLTYRAGAEMDLNSFYLGGEVTGYQSVIDDKYTDNPSRREVLAINNGSALKYYTVNPSLLDSQFWARWDHGATWAFQAGGGLTLAGSATAAGWNLFGKIVYRFQPESEFLAPSPVQPPPKQDVEKFQEEINDGIDQNLFKMPQETAPPPPKKTTPKNNLQQQLNNTEMQIELKRKKKKKN